MPEKGLRTCNFCGKPETKVQSMFSAGSNNICDECVTYCYELFVIISWHGDINIIIPRNKAFMPNCP